MKYNDQGSGLTAFIIIKIRAKKVLPYFIISTQISIIYLYNKIKTIAKTINTIFFYVV